VGESDIIADPRRAERSSAKANWQRLQALRQQYDRTVSWAFRGTLTQHPIA
jgi:hypothetical protein